MNRLTHHQQINKGFIDWQLPFYFSKPVLRHLTHFIDGMSSIGFTGKLTETHAFSHHQKHRTTLGHFLKNSPWNETYLLRQSQQYVQQNIAEDDSIFLLIDDTIAKKTKPSSRAAQPTESCGYHFSHTDGKSVWGYQVVQMMMKSGQHAHPYDFRLFDKETTDSKIQLSIDMMNQLPKFKQPSYLLCDSWYTSRKIIEAALSKGTHVIGALKTNRILYPQGICIQVKQFATHIQKEDTDLVTIGVEMYRVYRYEGALNDIENGIVLLCWPHDASMEPKNMRCFLSTDTELTSEQILTYYSHRWSIETYFKQVKGRLGFNGTQIRSAKAVQRYWVLEQFAYLFLGYLYDTPFTFAIHIARTKKFESIIEFVYAATTDGTSLEQIKNELQVA